MEERSLRFTRGDAFQHETGRRGAEGLDPVSVFRGVEGEPVGISSVWTDLSSGEEKPKNHQGALSFKTQ